MKQNVTLPDDDKPKAQLKMLTNLQSHQQVRQICDELQLICRSADLPLALQRAGDAYYGYAQMGLMSEHASKAAHETFLAHDKVLREAHHELGVTLERTYALYPRGFVLGDPPKKRRWQIWRKK
ncbi:hypothetical protein GCM10009593_30440 [Microlunatus antarcticus]